MDIWQIHVNKRGNMNGRRVVSLDRISHALLSCLTDQRLTFLLLWCEPQFLINASLYALQHILSQKSKESRPTTDFARPQLTKQNPTCFWKWRPSLGKNSQDFYRYGTKQYRTIFLAIRSGRMLMLCLWCWKRLMKSVMNAQALNAY